MASIQRNFALPDAPDDTPTGPGADATSETQRRQQQSALSAPTAQPAGPAAGAPSTFDYTGGTPFQPTYKPASSPPLAGSTPTLPSSSTPAGGVGGGGGGGAQMKPTPSVVAAPNPILDALNARKAQLFQNFGAATTAANAATAGRTALGAAVGEHQAAMGVMSDGQPARLIASSPEGQQALDSANTAVNTAVAKREAFTPALQALAGDYRTFAATTRANATTARANAISSRFGFPAAAPTPAASATPIAAAPTPAASAIPIAAAPMPTTASTPSAPTLTSGLPGITSPLPAGTTPPAAAPTPISPPVAMFRPRGPGAFSDGALGNTDVFGNQLPDSFVHAGTTSSTGVAPAAVPGVTYSRSGGIPKFEATGASVAAAQKVAGGGPAGAIAVPTAGSNAAVSAPTSSVTSPSIPVASTPPVGATTGASTTTAYDPHQNFEDNLYRPPGSTSQFSMPDGRIAQLPVPGINLPNSSTRATVDSDRERQALLSNIRDQIFAANLSGNNQGKRDLLANLFATQAGLVNQSGLQATQRSDAGMKAATDAGVSTQTQTRTALTDATNAQDAYQRNLSDTERARIYAQGRVDVGTGRADSLSRKDALTSAEANVKAAQAQLENAGGGADRQAATARLQQANAERDLAFQRAQNGTTTGSTQGVTNSTQGTTDGAARVAQLAMARSAIAQGAPPDAIKQRLVQMGMGDLGDQL